MTFEKLFVSLDILAPPIAFNIDGKSSHKTKIGACLTVGYICLLLLSVTFIVRNTVRKDMPVSSSEYAVSEVFPTYDLVAFNMLPAVVFYLGDTQLIKVEDLPKYLTIDLQKIRWEMDENGNSVKKTSNFKIKPCKDLTAKESAYLDYARSGEEFWSIILATGMCPIPDPGLVVFGKGADHIYEQITLRLRPCALDADCATREDLNKVNFYLILPDLVMNPSDYEKPYSQVLTAQNLYYLNTGNLQLVTQSLQTSEVHDYEGLIPSWNFKYKYAELGKQFSTSTYRKSSNVSCKPDEVLAVTSPACESYFEYYIQASGQRIRFKRRYKSATEMFGEIGGVKAVMMIFFVGIYGLFHSRLLENQMMKRVFARVDFESSADSISTEDSAKSNSPKQKSSSCWEKCFSCCKKRTKDEVFAIHSIQESLNVVRLVKELNRLHTLCQFLIPGSQAHLVPKVALSLRKMRLRNALTAQKTDKIRPSDASAIDIKNSKCLHMLKQDLDTFFKKVITIEIKSHLPEKRVWAKSANKVGVQTIDPTGNQKPDSESSMIQLNPVPADPCRLRIRRLKEFVLKGGYKHNPPKTTSSGTSVTAGRSSDVGALQVRGPSQESNVADLESFEIVGKSVDQGNSPAMGKEHKGLPLQKDHVGDRDWGADWQADEEWDYCP